MNDLLLTNLIVVHVNNNNKYFKVKKARVEDEVPASEGWVIPGQRTLLDRVKENKKKRELTIKYNSALKNKKNIDKMVEKSKLKIQQMINDDVVIVEDYNLELEYLNGYTKLSIEADAELEIAAHKLKSKT